MRAQEDREHDREKKHKGEDGGGRVAESGREGAAKGSNKADSPLQPMCD